MRSMPRDPRRLVVLVLAVILSLAGLAELSAQEKPRIVIYDVMTESYDPGKSRLLTDVFRSELFKTRLFDIIEKGVVQEADNAAPQSASGTGLGKTAAGSDDARLLAVGRAVAADKFLICSVEKFDRTIAMSLRIVDVASSFIDYSDNIFLSDENLIFDAVKEASAKIEFFYASGQKPESDDPESDLRAIWAMLKAESGDLEYLVAARQDSEEYLTIRQYDISFSPAQYVAVLKTKIDPEIIRTFLQAGISYDQTQRALALGIVKLDRFRDVFQKAGFNFEDYLDAYSRHIMTTDDYREYRKGYNSNYLNIGLGGVSDSFPIANAVYKFGLIKVSWERFWTGYQRDWLKYSTDAGLFFLNVIAPTPFVQGNAYAGNYPYYFKLGVGGFAEVILGGHFGAFVQMGMEIAEFLDFSVILVPFGTQPSVAYTDLKSRPGDPGYTKIIFPYAGVVATYKIPLKLR